MVTGRFSGRYIPSGNSIMAIFLHLFIPCRQKSTNMNEFFFLILLLCCLRWIRSVEFVPSYSLIIFFWKCFLLIENRLFKEHAFFLSLENESFFNLLLFFKFFALKINKNDESIHRIFSMERLKIHFLPLSFEPSVIKGNWIDLFLSEEKIPLPVDVFE